MPTFTQIGTAQVAGAGGATSFDFTAIPSTYTDLVIKLSLRSTRSSTWDNSQLKINNSAANMSNIYLVGNGATASSGSLSVFYIGDIPGNTTTANIFANQEIYLPNYAGSNNKSGSVDSAGELDSPTAYLFLSANLWSQTTAINQLTIVSGNANNFAQYSSAYLYGVSNA
jgi:hypothetical protein